VGDAATAQCRDLFSGMPAAPRCVRRIIARGPEAIFGQLTELMRRFTLKPIDTTVAR
jgi:hypothetical protein